MVLVVAAATGVFLCAVWRFVLMPSVQGVPRVRRAVVFLDLDARRGAIIYRAADLSDRQAFLVIAVVTLLAIRDRRPCSDGRRARVTAMQDEDHE